MRRNLETEWSENLDGFSSLQPLRGDANSGVLNDESDRSDHPLSLLWDILEIPILLTLIGISSAIISFVTSYAVAMGNSLRIQVVGTASDITTCIYYVLWCQVMALVACISTQLICRESAGGGLPEMKTILSGVVKPVLLSKRLIIAKISGLIFSLLAGLSVGKEGPFVHASAAMADQLMRLSFFRHLRTQDSKRLEIMACACASGVSGSFGTALGGVLFSIEFTASAYSVRTLPKAYLTSAVAMVVFFFLGASDQLSLFNSNRNESQWMPYSHEMIAFVLIGILCAILGVFFVYIVEIITGFRNKFLDKSKHAQETIDRRRILLVSAVTLVVSLMMFFEMASVPEVPRLLIDYMFAQENLLPLLPKLLLYFPYKFIVTALSVTLPLPVGLFTPVFMTGSVLGRIIGESICHWPLFVSFTNYSPSDYSILAAAGFSTGVTRAISTAVIVYELSGEPHLRLPLSVVILTAYFVGNRFSKNIYDALIDKNGTPYMQEIPKSMLNLPASEVMMPINESHVLALNSTYRDALLLIRATSNSTKAPSQLVEANATKQHIFTEFSSEENIELISRESISEIASSPRISHNNPFIEKKGYGSTDIEEPVSTIANEFKIDFRFRKADSAGKMLIDNCNVIPVVQSKKSMVIVGAVLREDVKTALDKLIKYSKVLDAQPVALGLRDEEEEIAQRIPFYDNTSAPNSPPKPPPLKRFSRGFRRANNAADNKVPLRAATIATAEGKADMNVSSRLLSISSDLAHFISPQRESKTPSQLPFRLIGVEDFPEERNEFQSSDEVLSDLLEETIQFVLFTNGGRSIVPVMSASLGMDHTMRRARSWRSFPTAIPIDPSPYQIVDSMLLCKVDLLFRMLSLNQAYVTNSGRLVGLVTRTSLRYYLDGHVKRPIDRCAQLFSAICSCCFGTKKAVNDDGETIYPTWSEEILHALKV